MDGWHGDENECNGDCGTYDKCDSYYQEADDAYDAFRDE
jgi:hypothetical protein